MNSIINQISKWALVFLIQAALISCATGQPMYFHSFDFNALSDAKIYGQPEIDILDFSYGNSRQFGTHADPEIVASGHPINQHGIAGMMPRGEYLYVKWRVKATGEIHEDRVDLSHKLPADMSNYDLHFAIFGSQLYVYLFPPFQAKGFLGEMEMHGGQPPGRERGKTLLDVPYAQQHQIYPDAKK